MSKMLMTSYVTNLPLCIFLLYVMVRGDQELVAMLTYGFWFVSSLGNILVLSGQAALVHEAAHSPVDNLFDVRADLANSRQLAQLQLFISRLTGTSIGFTALGIVTITKEMLLTVQCQLVMENVDIFSTPTDHQFATVEVDPKVTPPERECSNNLKTYSGRRIGKCIP
nr:hypothetical protein BaRGS_003706 [Batillaria attramentaria]